MRVKYHLVADSKVVEETIESDGVGTPAAYPADAQVRNLINTKPNTKVKVMLQAEHHAFAPKQSDEKMRQKHLWRCTWDESRLADHRVAADCRHAWPIKSHGLDYFVFKKESNFVCEGICYYTSKSRVRK